MQSTCCENEGSGKSNGRDCGSVFKIADGSTHGAERNAKIIVCGGQEREN